MKNYIQISIRTKTETTSADFGRKFLSQFIGPDGRLTPEFFDSDRARYNSTPFCGIDDALIAWSQFRHVDGMFGEYDTYDAAKWKRKSEPRYSCDFSHTTKNRYGDILTGSVDFTAKWNPKVGWLQLFSNLCEASNAYMAMFHHFTPLEVTKPKSYFAMGMMGASIDPRFRDIPWAMMVGKELTPKIDFETLKFYNFPVEKCGDGHLILVTDNLLDVSQRFDHFVEHREVLRHLLPTELFFDYEEHRRKQLEFMLLFKEYKAKQGIEVKIEPF